MSEKEFGRECESILSEKERERERERERVLHDLIYCNSFRSLLHAINFLLMQNVAFDEMKFWRVDFFILSFGN